MCLTRSDLSTDKVPRVLLCRVADLNGRASVSRPAGDSITTVGQATAAGPIQQQQHTAGAVPAVCIINPYWGTGTVARKAVLQHHDVMQPSATNSPRRVSPQATVRFDGNTPGQQFDAAAARSKALRSCQHLHCRPTIRSSSINNTHITIRASAAPNAGVPTEASITAPNPSPSLSNISS